MKVETSNEEKEFFPGGITKGEVIEYYKKIYNRIIPFLKDRPLVMKRYPDGIEENGFYQKQVPDYFPGWVQTVDVEKRQDGKEQLVVCSNKSTLIYIVNQGTLTMHPWLSRRQKLGFPDQMIFDLDPGKSTFSKVKDAAKDLKDVLDGMETASFVKTTGSKGLHVAVPLKPMEQFSIVRDWARDIAQALVEKDEKKYTLEQRKNKRGKRIFIDYLRNSYAQTAVAPYAVRAREKAPVACPVGWDELRDTDSSQRFNIQNILKRRKNPWKNFWKSKCRIKKKLKKL